MVEADSSRDRRPAASSRGGSRGGGRSRAVVFIVAVASGGLFAAACVLLATSGKEPAEPRRPARPAPSPAPPVAPAPPKRARTQPKPKEPKMEAEQADLARTERWGIFEATFKGPEGGNPFVDVKLGARFTQGDRSFEPEGFYDGGGTYRVRFMPDALGKWSYVTKSNRPELDGKGGEFLCVEPSPGNHGPVRVEKTWHFAYADGTRYHQIGTTCYCWTHQGDEMEARTLATLKSAPFNKLRMCVFPKAYAYNENEPKYYPFEGTPPKRWDFARPNPEFFRHFEKRVGEVRDLGIEADLILFHPYDRWGFKSMPREVDDRYLRYVVARLAAYRNVWWSMANEYDLMLKIPSKQMSDWDRFFQVVKDADPYGRMRGNHNCRRWYDHTKSWITHCSIQSSDFDHPRQWREKYRKPIVYDECKYEGNIPQGWGKISAREMVRRFWLGTIAGCYVGHGETYRHPKDILWWSKGGVLHGESPARIAFLKTLVEPLPFADMTPEPPTGGAHLLSLPGQLYLVYCDAPDKVTVRLAGERSYRAEAIDTWGMTVEALGAAEPGEFTYTPPGRGWLLRLSALAPGEKILARPEISAEPAAGKVPLKVRFSFRTSEAGALRRRWDFGDGETATDAAPVHVYTKPGMYTARLTVTDDKNRSASATVSISAEGAPGTAIVKVGFKEGDHPRANLHGRIARAADGSYHLPAGPPWGWIAVGDRPVKALEGLRSFTIMGWARPTELDTGRGGNRIAFNLKYNRAGLDLVHHADGRLRLSVNEWPDQVRNDSSRGKLRAGEWTFFAVAYDSTRQRDNVRWYFGGADAPAALDRTTSYSPGPTGTGSGPLTIGNYNTTIHRHGTDRQFRGSLYGIRILGSRTGPGGALSLEAVRKLQSEPGAVPDFKAAPARSDAARKAVARTTPRPDTSRATDAASAPADTPVPPAGARPRIIATTDGEIDDRCSMVRFLLYANEWDIEGIVHCSSKFHWKGDGKGIKRHNWADEVWLDKQIDRYEQLYPKLSRHAKGFPTADALRKLVYTGNVVNVGEMNQDTPGSDRIVEILLDAKPGPVYLQAWGGTNTIARALWKIEHEHRDQMAKVSRKAVIYIILDQDNTFRRYIQPKWPDAQVLGSFRQFATIAYSWDGKIPRDLHRYFDKSWMQRNILRGHGPLCARYEVHGRKGFRSEGDSPAFMHQIPVGLRSLEHPGYGGWGGRFVKDRRGRNVWRGAKDGGDLGKPIWRWAEAFQNDWAARADWCVKGVREANHPPRAKVAGALDRTVRPGQKVTLSAEGSTDPDGDKLAYRWWQYDDVDTVATKIDIAASTSKTGAGFVVPNEPGRTIHVVLDVTDDGDPPLTRYRRIVFTVGR